MQTLIERYMSAALEGVPEARRKDVGAEIRGAIDEMVEQRIEAGEPEDAAVRSALNELGNPRALAAAYDDRQRYLIGPGWYPAYIEVLKYVLGAAIAVVAVIAMVTALASDGADLGDAAGGAVEVAIEVGLQVLFWVTIGFVIAERTQGPAFPGVANRAWSVDDLPAVHGKRQIPLGETMVNVVTLVILGALLVIQQARGTGFFARGVLEGAEGRLPVLNPELGTPWVVGAFALLALSIALAIARYVRGYWTRPLFLATLGDSALWLAYIVTLAYTEPIFNRELMHHIDGSREAWWSAGGSANLITAVVITAIVLWETWEAYRGHRHYRRMEMVAA